jgi:hypothetical protein
LARPAGLGTVRDERERVATLEPATPGLEDRFCLFPIWPISGYFRTRMNLSNCGSLLKRMVT